MSDHFEDEQYAQGKPWAIAMPPTPATPIPSIPLKIKNTSMHAHESFTWVFFFTGSNETVCSLPGFRLLEVMVTVHAGNDGGL